MRRVLGVSTVIDPVHRERAQVIVEMVPEARVGDYGSHP